MRNFLLLLVALLVTAIVTGETAHASMGGELADGLSGTGWLAMGLGMAAFGMACSTDIGAALRGGGCKPATGPRNWIRIDQPDGTRAYPNAMVQTRWAALSNRDPMRRYAYVRSLAIRGNVEITLGAANDAVSAYQLRSLINQIDLMDVAGHKFFAALDARDVIDDIYYRHGRLPYALPGAIALNEGAGAITRQIDIEIPLVSRAVGASQLEGLIPVAALQKASAEAFQFFLRDTIQGAPQGVTVDGYTRPDGTPGLEIWGEIVWIAPNVADVPPVIDGPWMVRNYVLQGSDQVLESEGRKHTYAHIRYRPEDTFNSPGGVTGQELAAAIDGFTLEVGGTGYMTALRTVDLRERGIALKREGVTAFGDSADALGLADLVLPAEPSVTTPDVYTLPWRPTEDAPAGPVIVHMATQPCTSTRWLHRSVGCDNSSRVDAIKAAMGCECPVKVMTNGDGQIDGALPKLLVK